MKEEKLLNRAFWLAIITIAYNIIEGTISVIFGMHDETLALFGFGVDRPALRFTYSPPD